MRRYFLFFSMFLLLIASNQVYSQSGLPVIPQPVQYRMLGGDVVVLKQQAAIVGPPARLGNAVYLAGLLQQYASVTPQVHTSLLPDAKIVLEPGDATLNRPEMYRLTVSDHRIVIQANDNRGYINAFQTLIQLFEPVAGGVQIRPVEIVDYPKFLYRGMHLDVARHFFPVSYIKQYIDYMAFHKFNRFHWHLTDDQGWRIESKRYPKLNEIGSWRDSTLIGHFKDTPVRYEHARYGGYYTQDQILEIVSYAAERGITVIPEIDIPGHSRAAIAAYPQLGTEPDRDFPVAATWGMYNRQNNVLAPNRFTIQFLKDIFNELCELFPGEYIHLGGDECSRKWWKADKRSQTFIQSHQLNGEAGLQNWMVQLVDSVLRSQGRIPIGWHEVADGLNPKDAFVMNWADDAKALQLASKGFNLIMTPGKPFYFDHYQTAQPGDSLAIHGYNSLESVYSYSVIPPAVTAAGLNARILGGQANVWTEYMPYPSKVDYMIFPRMTALCENLWGTNRSYSNFLIRLRSFMYPRYRQWGASFFVN